MASNHAAVAVCAGEDQEDDDKRRFNGKKQKSKANKTLASLARLEATLQALLDDLEEADQREGVSRASANNGAGGPEDDDPSESLGKSNNPLFALYVHHRPAVLKNYAQYADNSEDERLRAMDRVVNNTAFWTSILGGATVVLATSNPVYALLSITAKEAALLHAKLLVIMKIAAIQGYSLTESDFVLRVQPAVLGIDFKDVACEAGYAVPIVLSTASSGDEAGRKLLMSVARRYITKNIPRGVFKGVNRKFGLTITEKNGKRLLAFGKALPFVGLLVGGALNWDKIKTTRGEAIPYFPYYDVYMACDWCEEVCTKILNKLQAHGLKVKVSDPKADSATSTNDYRSGIDETKCVLIGVSAKYKYRAAVPNDICRLEFEYAFNAKPKSIIPLRLEDVKLDGPVLGLGSVVPVDILEHDEESFGFETDVLRLADYLGTLLELPHVCESVRQARYELKTRMSAGLRQIRTDLATNSANGCCTIQ